MADQANTTEKPELQVIERDPLFAALTDQESTLCRLGAYLTAIDHAYGEDELELRHRLVSACIRLAKEALADNETAFKAHKG